MTESVVLLMNWPRRTHGAIHELIEFEDFITHPVHGGDELPKPWRAAIEYIALGPRRTVYISYSQNHRLYFLFL